MKDRIKREIIKFLPIKIRELLQDNMLEGIEEIRLRVHKPVIFRYLDKEMLLSKDGQDYFLKKEELDLCFESICNNSVYAFQEELSNGFITIFGGHRVGICGKPLYKDGKIYSMKEISAINIRVARQIIGCSENIIPDILIDNKFSDTLIVSPPGLGKTTILRDLIRKISNGGNNVSVVDERSEIAATFKGIAQNDIGIRTDVMDSVSKSDGIIMLVRAMKPDFIATDEIGADDDVMAILYAVNSGVKIIATAHGSSMEDLKRRKSLCSLIEQGIFKKIVFLKKNREFEVVSYGINQV